MKSKKLQRKVLHHLKMVKIKLKRFASRSTVSVSTSRGAPPSTLSVKGQIETVKVKGAVEHSACVQ
ncbi:hypothetical protein Nmel_004644 [Mimus melanotis]